MSRVLEYAKSVPWAILPEALETIMAVASRELSDPEAIERAVGAKLDGTQRSSVRGGVAVVPVRGPMFRYANLLTLMSGATSTEVLANDIGTALADPAVAAIVLDIDSPGGMVNGTSELAALIAKARGEKPIVAHISGTGASGAYWLASAADRVTADRAALVGSVGAVMGFRKVDDRDGVRTMEFVSSQSPKKRLDPLDDDAGRAQEARADIQALVDDLAAVFISDVARNRGVSVEKVLADFGQGGVMVGEVARVAGMVDELTTLESLIASLSDGRRPRGTAGLRPAAATGSPQRSTSTTEASMADSETPAAAQAPVIDRAYLDAHHRDLVASIRTEGAGAERERIAAIQGLAGPEDVKAEAVQSGASAGDAAVKILAAQKAAEEAKKKAHLDGLVSAEGDTPKVGPAADAGEAGDERTRARRAVAQFNQLKGRASVPAA